MNNRAKWSIKNVDNWSQARDTSHEKSSTNLNLSNLNLKSIKYLIGSNPSFVGLVVYGK